MNAKAKAKKNLIRIGALLLAALIFIGMLASCTGGSTTTTSGFDYSGPMNSDGYFKNVKALDAVTLPDYSAYEMPKKYTEADQETVDEEIQEVIDNFTTHEADADTSRAIVNGDTVNIDYVGTVDGVEFEGGSTGGEGTDVTIGVTNYIDGFLEQLIGRKPGENFDINVTFPEDYGNEELNGKDAVFNITINHFYKDIIPELTDEFVAENLGNYYSTVDEMIADIEARIIKEQMNSYVWDKLYAESEMLSYPRQMMQYERDYLKAYMESYASQFGMEADDFVTLSGYESMDAYLEANVESMQETVKMYAVIQAVCEKEDLKVTEDDIVEYFKTYYGTEDYSAFESTYGRPYIKFCILREVMLDKLASAMPVVE